MDERNKLIELHEKHGGLVLAVQEIVIFSDGTIKEEAHVRVNKAGLHGSGKSISEALADLK